MARVKVKINTRTVSRAVKQSVEEAVHDIADDLIRTSSESAPHDKGILEQSYGKSVAWDGDKCVAVVDYSVKEENGNGGFNYALWIHEDMDYEYGEGTLKKAKSGGGVGMSGKQYPVGRKFLTRPLYGEEEAYTNHIQKSIDEAIK